MAPRNDTASAKRSVSVTPSDSAALEPTRGVYVGGTGDLAVILADDATAQTFEAVSAGTLLPISVKKVMATNTTATAILAVY